MISQWKCRIVCSLEGLNALWNCKELAVKIVRKTKFLSYMHKQASKQALYTHMHYIINAQKSNCNETVPQASVLLVTVN